MGKNFKKYAVGTLSSIVAVSLITTSVYAEEVKVQSKPVVEQTVTSVPVSVQTTTPIITTVSENVTTVTIAPTTQQTTAGLDLQPIKELTSEEQAYIDNYLRELSKESGGAPVGLMFHEVEELLKKREASTKGQVQKSNTVSSTKKTKNDNLEHSVVEDKEIEKGLYSVKFVTLDKKTDKKKVHDFKKEENNKDKEKEQVDYSKEPARVGTTPGAAYAIVELEDGVYGQLVADRKTGKKLITVKYDLLKETIEKGSWEYKDEEVVEVKKEDADDKVEETTTTTKSR